MHYTISYLQSRQLLHLETRGW